MTELPNDVPAMPDDLSDPRLPVEGGRRGSLLALTSGVIDDRKNLPYLFEALGLMKPENRKHTALLVAGDGPLLRFYEDTAPENVVFLGWRRDLPAINRRVDLVLHPSRHEGMSNSVLEALAAGCPVIGGDTPEMRELLAADELLVDLKDPGSLARILDRMVEDRDGLEPLRRASEAAAEKLRFDWDGAAVALVESLGGGVNGEGAESRGP